MKIYYRRTKRKKPRSVKNQELFLRYCRDGVTCAELSRKFQVSIRTAKRLREKLRDNGHEFKSNKVGRPKDVIIKPKC